MKYLSVLWVFGGFAIANSDIGHSPFALPPSSVAQANVVDTDECQSLERQWREAWSSVQWRATIVNQQGVTSWISKEGDEQLVKVPHSSQQIDIQLAAHINNPFWLADNPSCDTSKWQAVLPKVEAR